ncbi:hypothetical protein P154DRAFT_306632 [Amniculicola lignicola CBS 123094]|uniref:BRCT domain-containing protein n=1 Tax=Amniculicola lignicola CBS 123094 TaxID=1392246 RepID=A0A6A5W7F6_9PLEO|nr:hypothetical protein P154DRAFT_306632 [Amniculicola lignicola CBS 123094]
MAHDTRSDRPNLKSRGSRDCPRRTCRLDPWQRDATAHLASDAHAAATTTTMDRGGGYGKHPHVRMLYVCSPPQGPARCRSRERSCAAPPSLRSCACVGLSQLAAHQANALQTQISAVGAQMGATIKLDLTSDVTHLIVGSIHSAKYRYVAKCREDVRVLAPEWLEALRTVWMEGEDVDAKALEEQYRLPTFAGLKICLTGFDNPDQRRYIQEQAIENGAEYHGDLTKNITHLIAATPHGKKYEHAVNWKMEIVSFEWFQQSLQRGMALDEAYFHPTMPVEERGKGAWERRQQTSPALGKRPREPEQGPALNPLRRKLRRSASSRMGTQSEALWAGITAAGLERNADREDEWTEAKSEANLTPTHSEIPAHDAQPADPASDIRRGLDAPHANKNENDGIFQGRVVLTHAFDQDKTDILQTHLASNGAGVLRSSDELAEFSSDDLRRGYLVVPHDVQTDLRALPEAAGGMSLVTNWWVEQCLFGKRLVDPSDHVLSRPFNKLSISGFGGLTITPTAFTGIDLLQVTKVITLMGATFDEYLTPKTSVVVCNTRKPNPEKIKFATDKRIPAVHSTWLWDCLRTGDLQLFEKYMLNTIAPAPRTNQVSQEFREVPTARLSEEDSAKLRERKTRATKLQKPRNGTHRPGTLDLISADPLTASTTATSTNSNTTPNISPLEDEDDEPFLANFDGPNSHPLQPINPEVNSPRRPSTTSNPSTTHPNTKANSVASDDSTSSAESLIRRPLNRTTTRTREKDITPDLVIPPAPEEIEQDEGNEKEKEKGKGKEKDYDKLMSDLMAKRHASKLMNPQPSKDAPRRKRALGRAASTRSNPSTAGEGEPGMERAGSVAAGIGEEEDEVWKEREMGMYAEEGFWMMVG